MPVLCDTPSGAPYEREGEELPIITFHAFSMLFLESQAGLRSLRHHISSGYSSSVDDEVASDDDDTETVGEATPRQCPVKTKLEDPGSGFRLEERPSPTETEASSSSSGSSSGDASISGFNSNRNAPERKLDQGHSRSNSDKEKEFSGDNNNGFSSDGSGLTSDDENETLIERLFQHEERLGNEFVYIDEALVRNDLYSSQSIHQIIYSLQRARDSYIAAMRIFMKWNEVDEDDEDAQQELLEKVQREAEGAVEEWFNDCPEYEWPLGCARFALIGQLIRLDLFSETYVADMIVRMENELHLDGRTQVLETLIYYAGPRICVKENFKAIFIIDAACNKLPNCFVMKWVLARIKRDMAMYYLRKILVSDDDCRCSRDKLRDVINRIRETGEPRVASKLLTLVMDPRDHRLLGGMAQIGRRYGKTKRAEVSAGSKAPKVLGVSESLVVGI